MCVSNHKSSDFDDLPFDGDKRLITRELIYCVNYDIVERLKSDSIIDIYMN